MATPEWVKRELRANFAPASAAGRKASRSEPRASRITYRPREHALRIVLTNGAAITLPVRLIPGLSRASSREVRTVRVLGNGGGIHWAHLDLDLSVPELVASVFATRTWMAELGRAGGRKTSAVKANAARRNGRKGGRPRVRASAGTRA